MHACMYVCMYVCRFSFIFPQIYSLLSIRHSQRLLKSTFTCFSIKLTFSLLKRRQISSVFSLKSQSVTADSTSVTYNKKVWILEELNNLKHLVLRGFSQGLNKISVFQIRFKPFNSF